MPITIDWLTTYIKHENKNQAVEKGVKSMDLEEYMTKQMAAYKLDPADVTCWVDNIQGFYGIVRAPFNDSLRMRRILRHSVGLLILTIANKPYDLHRVGSNLFWSGHPQHITFDEGITQLVSITEGIVENFSLGIVQKESIFNALLILAKMAASELKSLSTLADADGAEIDGDLSAFHNLPPLQQGSSAEVGTCS